ncbi:MAG TPA: hypothetical protein VF885_18965 [Arthrobacter sp.]
MQIPAPFRYSRTPAMDTAIAGHNGLLPPTKLRSSRSEVLPASGRRGRVRDGGTLSPNDYEKTRLEDQRPAWLDGHPDTLAAACRGARR